MISVSGLVAADAAAAAAAENGDGDDDEEGSSSSSSSSSGSKGSSGSGGTKAAQPSNSSKHGSSSSSSSENSEEVIHESSWVLVSSARSRNVYLLQIKPTPAEAEMVTTLRVVPDGVRDKERSCVWNLAGGERACFAAVKDDSQTQGDFAVLLTNKGASKGPRKSKGGAEDLTDVLPSPGRTKYARA